MLQVTSNFIFHKKQIGMVTKIKPTRIKSQNHAWDWDKLWYLNLSQFKWNKWDWVVYMTQREYNALPESKLNDDVTYIIIPVPVEWQTIVNIIKIIHNWKEYKIPWWWGWTSINKFLSLWNANTWNPISFPEAIPYAYSTWDWFLVDVVNEELQPTNYRPDTVTYTGNTSTEVEMENVKVWDVYIFDWLTWLLQHNSSETVDVSFSNIVWDPTDNVALANELDSKVSKVTTSSVVYWTSSSWVQNTYKISSSATANSVAYRWSGWVLTVWTPTANTHATTKKYVDDALAQKQNVLTAGSNIDITNNVISATDTTYTAWDWIDITWTVISSTVTSDVTDVKVDGNSVLDDNKVANIDLSWKQDVLTAWHNITITNNTISSVDELPSWGTVWQVLTKTSSGTAWWDMSEWDMKYEDFEFASKSWASVVLDLSSTITPTSNFTVNVPTEIKEWQIYVLRVTNWATSYTMTLWGWITNPRWTSLSLTANTTDQFVFYAVSNSVLELQAEWWWSWWPENIFVTQAEYDALTPEAGKTYFIYEEEN